MSRDRCCCRFKDRKVTKKVPFSVFVEKIAGHVITNVKYGIDNEACIRKVQYPFIDFESRHKPEPLVDGENAPFGDKWLFQERLKAYVSRENQLQDNIVKVYGLVWRNALVHWRQTIPYTLTMLSFNWFSRKT